jgi:hypothetical protein
MASRDHITADWLAENVPGEILLEAIGLLIQQNSPRSESVPAPIKRTRDQAKENEDKDIQYILDALNNPQSPVGKKLKANFHNKFGKHILGARRGDLDKGVGGRKVHYDFQIQTKDGWHNIEHKGSTKYGAIDPSKPPWTGGVQFYNGGMEKYRFAQKYAQDWYKMYIGSGLLKAKYNISAPLPSLEEWMSKDAKTQGDPRTSFGIELKKKYRELHDNKKVSLTAERDEFVKKFYELCTEDDICALKEDILPILKDSLAQKHYWLQIAGNLEKNEFNCAWSKQLEINEIQTIKIELRSDIWLVVECENNFTFEAILRFGKGSGFSNIRLDLR